MHIAEGVLSAPVLIGGGLITIAGLARGLRSLDSRRVPQTGVLSAALFVASLVHVPVGGASAHLVLSGLAGMLLGWAVFPAAFVALLLQAVLFQFGGFTTIGVNTAVIACPAILSYWLFRGPIQRGGRAGFAAAFAGGAVPVAVSGILVAAALRLSGAEFTHAAIVLLAAHVPILVVEGFIGAFCIAFLRTVKPELMKRADRTWEPGHAT